MKFCCSTIILAILWAFKVIHTNSFQECPEGNYVIIDTNGKKIVCLLCQKCVIGSGLTPPCGTRVLQNANIDCRRCEPGKTYSEDIYEPSSCKTCQICSVMMKNCTPESNTKCSKTCGNGYYYDNATYNCQPCSQCCGTDSKKVAQCIGLPLNLQCSVHYTQECSHTPKPTNNTSSSSDGSTGDNALNNVCVVIGVFIGIIILIALIVVFVWLRCSKCRRKPLNDLQEAMPLENNSTCTCGMKKMSFSITTRSSDPNGKVQEGVKVTLMCEYHSSSQDNIQYQDCDYIYEWKKDIMDYTCLHRQNVELNPVSVKDFGIYTCQVSCRLHAHQVPMEAIKLDLDVLPRPGKRYKKFSEIDSHQTYKEIADKLKSPPTDIGDWKGVAERYGMGHQKIQYLQDDENRAMDIINYIMASQTELTVYDFCKFMKTIKQNQVVVVLEDHLTYENEESGQLGARDSGFCAESYELQNAANASGQNNVGLINSRQGSKDELADNSCCGSKHPDKSNQKLARQVSNHSATSSGSGLGAGSLLRTAQGLARQISQNSTYKKHENEHNEPQ